MEWIEKYDALSDIGLDEFNSNNAEKLWNEEFTAILKKETWLWN
jgi:hypothetical protein